MMLPNVCNPIAAPCRANFFLFLALIVFVDGRILCEDGYTELRHVEYGTGSCVIWGPPDDADSCCLFCSSLNSIKAAQYIPPGKHDPFSGHEYNEPACCCYNSSVVLKGGDGTYYYE